MTFLKETKCFFFFRFLSPDAVAHISQCLFNWRLRLVSIDLNRVDYVRTSIVNYLDWIHDACRLRCVGVRKTNARNQPKHATAHTSSNTDGLELTFATHINISPCGVDWSLVWCVERYMCVRNCYVAQCVSRRRWRRRQSVNVRVVRVESHSEIYIAEDAEDGAGE